MSRNVRGLLVTVIAVLPVLPLAGMPQAEAGKRYALLVGINVYHHNNFTRLQFAENDATELGDVLKQQGYDVTVLTGKQATLSNLRTALKKLLAGKGGDDVVLVGLAGHGRMFNADSYFCVQDAEFEDKETMLALASVYEQLGNCGAKAKLLLMDACRDDGKRGGKRGADQLPPAAPRGVGILFGCGEGEYAFEAKDYKHGVFFYHVLEGFKGEAKNKEGDVTWDLLRAHVKAEVPKDVKRLFGATGGRQIPNAVENLSEVPVLAKARSVALGRTLELDLGGGVKMKLVRIEPGTFLMGSPKDEKDRYDRELQHQVEITKPFYLGVYAVTQAQYRQVMGKNPSYFCADGDGKNQVAGMNTDDFPVERVSWHDAMAFCEKVSALAALKEKGWQADLPTEAEWEYACRAGTKTVFHYGDSLSSKQANFHGKYPYGGAAEGPYKGRTVEVGSYQANAWGLYDMHGNVYQWCRDWYGEKYYENGDNKDPQGPQKGEYRVLRGGSWYDDARFCRAAFRLFSGPADSYFGFRVAVLPSARTRND